MCLLASLAHAQWWQRRDHRPNDEYRRDATYDEQRDRVVFHAGSQLWEWVADDWVHRANTGLSYYTQLAYDSHRGRTVLFDGLATGTTWEWDGARLAARTVASPPSPRRDHAMTFDRGRRRTLLFGGILAANFTPTNETWEFDGTTWTLATPAQAPPAMVSVALAYDAVRGRAVLVGTPPQLPAETWEWDGTNWTRAAVATPTSSWPPDMAFDARRGRTVLVHANGPTTWEWDGRSWTPGPTSSSMEPSLVYHGGMQRVLRFDASGQIAGYDGTQWTLVGTHVPIPTFSPASFFDDSLQRVVCLGYLGGATPGPVMAQWDGFTWRQLAGTTPTQRSTVHVAYDRGRRRAVLFGGLDNATNRILGDTWEWDGQRWTLRATGGPPPRWDHGMAYDARRQRVVMFGGQAASLALLNDTWEWDGTVWTQRLPATSPSPRKALRLAFDAVRGEILLYGGSSISDTWTWNGTNWIARSPPVSPPARVAPLLDFDPVRQRIVMAGGYPSETDTWEWDGTSWQPFSAFAVQGQGLGMAFDEARQRMVLLAREGTWWLSTLVRTESPAVATVIGTPCGGTTAPALTTFGKPLVGRGTFAFDVAGARPAAPAALVASAGPASLPIGGGCTLRVDPALPQIALGSVTTPSGSASWPVPIPAIPSLAGTTFFVQAAVLSPQGAAFGFDFSAGLRVVLGD